MILSNVNEIKKPDFFHLNITTAIAKVLCPYTVKYFN